MNTKDQIIEKLQAHCRELDTVAYERDKLNIKNDRLRAQVERLRAVCESALLAIDENATGQPREQWIDSLVSILRAALQETL